MQQLQSVLGTPLHRAGAGVVGAVVVGAGGVVVGAGTVVVGAGAAVVGAGGACVGLFAISMKGHELRLLQK